MVLDPSPPPRISHVDFAERQNRIAILAFNSRCDSCRFSMWLLFYFENSDSILILLNRIAVLAFNSHSDSYRFSMWLLRDPDFRMDHIVKTRIVKAGTLEARIVNLTWWFWWKLAVGEKEVSLQEIRSEFEFVPGFFWHSIAGRVFVRCVATHRNNYNWIWIHRTRIMTICRVLDLSDSPGRAQICWEFFPTERINIWLDS